MAKRKPRFGVERVDHRTGKRTTLSADEAQELFIGGLCGSLELAEQLQEHIKLAPAVVAMLSASLAIAVDAVAVSSPAALMALAEKRYGRDVIDSLVERTRHGMPATPRKRRARIVH